VATGGTGVVELAVGGLDELDESLGPAADAVDAAGLSGALVLAAPVRPPGDPVVQPAVTASSAAASEPRIQRC